MHTSGAEVVLTEPEGRWARARPFACAAAGGVCCFLGFVGFGIWPLALVCFIPLWQALEETHAGAWCTTALVGFTFGWIAYAGGYHWIWRIVDVFLGGNIALGATLWLADSSWFALRFAIYALLYRRTRQRGWPITVAALPSFVATEWLYPGLFPVNLGHSLAAQIHLIQISDLGGPLLLTALLVLINVAIFEMWRWRRGERRAPVWSAAVTGVAVILAWGYGAIRIDDIERLSASAPALRVGIVQGNLGVFEKSQRAEADHRRYLEQTRQLLAHEAVELVLWPETVYTRGLLRPLPLSGRLIREDLNVPLLFGAASTRTETGRRLRYNSALLIGADGVIRNVYDKNLLIPFTEYVPFADLVPTLAERLADASHFSAGTDTPALSLGPWRISTPICYEVARPDYVRRMVLAGKANLIATISNDSWFGDSQEPWIHLAMAKFRAIEHRRYLVRATNSGISAVVDPTGREITRSGVLTRENLSATVHLIDQATIYTRFGDWPGWIATTMVLLSVGTGWRRTPAGS